MTATDPRSEKSISTLLPEVRPLARALVHKASALGIQIRVISGFRTYEEQAALYAQGRTTPGRVITNARPGYSNHNFGIAFDVGVFEGSRYLGESPKYKAVGALGMDIGLEWGGSWKTLVDEPHFQLRPDWAAGHGRAPDAGRIARTPHRRVAGLRLRAQGLHTSRINARTG
jgi:peptidoglycan L-alanyl-D-glutamate endopeptidase CwlK